MSEHHESSSEFGARRRRDAGFTLPELLVSIIVLGSIVAVLSSAIIVTFRQQDNTEGRLNVTRAEQNVDMWIPADLASSASTAWVAGSEIPVPSKDPNLSPCSDTLAAASVAATCPPGLNLTGSNALFLSWTDLTDAGPPPVFVTTRVSYHFTPRGDGTFDLMRIACTSTVPGPWTCDVNTVLTDLPGPTDGSTFKPGETMPWWVITVDIAPPPLATDPSAPPATGPGTKNANRVVVTIRGGGDSVGGGGGENQVSLTAGGTTRNTLGVDSGNNAPTFAQTQSRCGGPLTLIVDDSGSINSGATGTPLPMDQVKTAIKGFITSLSGTPVQIQIVRFDDTASVLGNPGGWTKYYDMTVQTDVTDLKALVDTLVSSGGTNWEDAWFRTFYAQDGTPAAITPSTVVFFTDGVPTWERLLPGHRGNGGAFDPLKPPAPLPGYFESTGYATDYSQVGFDRADYYAAERRAADDTRLIGVGVGKYIGTLAGPIPPAPPETQSEWMSAPRVGYHEGWEERTNWDWEQSGFTYQQLVTTYAQLVTTYAKSTFTYQQNVVSYREFADWDEMSNPNPWQRRKVGNTTWNNTSRTNYDNNVQTGGGPWEYQISPTIGWVNSTRALYDASNTTPDDKDGWKRSNGRGAWIPRTLALYNANNTLAGDTDGVSNNQWVSILEPAYNAGNAPGNNDDTDGFRRTTTNTGWAPILEPEFTANNTTPDDGDGFRYIATWNPIDAATYNAGNTPGNTDDSDGFRSVSTWNPILVGAYNAGNAPGNNDESDGFRRTSTGSGWTDTTRVIYQANNTTESKTTSINESDGFRRRSPSGSSWVAINEAKYTALNVSSAGESDGYRRGGRVYTEPTLHTDFEDADSVTTRNAQILARLITGSFSGSMVVPWSGTLNDNERLANMFVEPNYSLVPAALKAVALGECGGTLTLQTKTALGYANNDFEYQNTALKDSSNNPLVPKATKVVTSVSVKAVTFDFNMTDGLYRTVDIEPLNGSALEAAKYTGGTWSCTAGGVNMVAPLIVNYDIPDSIWTGLRVRVDANEAVSCTHLVTRLP